MSNTSIADAICTLEELLTCLDDAYWEASSITGKDKIYDLISAVTRELSELNKLSVQDHNLTYEIVSTELAKAKKNLFDFNRVISELVLRARTADRLEEQLGYLYELIDN